MNATFARLPRAAVLAAALFAGDACALEFRSVAEAAVLYDAPSAKAQKLFVLSRGYPVEVIVKVEGWTKVRDDTGQFAWIENAQLASRRTVMVRTASAEARVAASDASAVAFTAEKGVYLDLLDASAGWVRVRHRDGATGFIKVSQLWGL
ncbi:MAG TPA: SH3 domain-containing protein [Burkholderiales bacterium]|nr:SH3 domain-containing protein [Burkholderiales bacterium]